MKHPRFVCVCVAGAIAAAPFFLPVAAAGQAGQGEASSGLVRILPEEPAPTEVDADGWRASLSDENLDARERAFVELVERAGREEGLATWLREAAAEQGGELAWTARLALRELETRRTRGPLAWGRNEGFDDVERWLEEMVGRIAPGWNHRIDPLVIPFPGLHVQQRTPGVAGARRVDIHSAQDGWTLRVREQVDGEETVREFKGDTLEEILEANPKLKQEVNIAGVLRAPGLSLRIGVPEGGAFDFDGFLGRVGEGLWVGGREAWGDDPLFGGRRRAAEQEAVRTDVLGVIAQPATVAQGGAGLLVRETVARTPAALLGIAAGDILLEVNGVVLTQVQDVTRALSLSGEDGAIHAVWRDGLQRHRVGTWRP